MLVNVANLAAAAVTAVLAVSSGRNIFQTINVANVARQGPIQSVSLQPNDSTEVVISKVKAMKRKELLELYFSSRGPKDMAEIEGEWDGSLLDNQSWIMTAVTALLTDRLFGMGRRWNGKQFGTTGSPEQGINRFYPRQSSSAAAADTEHNFDMSIQPSKLGSQDSSLVLDYTQYQFPLSLWRTMMDEIRIVSLDGEEPRVLIGLGYMAWSGGRWNSSPFLLYRRGVVESTSDEPTASSEL